MVAEKQNYLKNETQILKVESDRRRVSMLVEGILDPDMYLAAVADFILTISQSMEVVLRPPQQNGKQG